MKRSSAFVALTLAFLLFAALASAQEVISKYEVGINTSVFRQGVFGSDYVSAGVGGRLTYNLSKTVAFESALTFYMHKPEFPTDKVGGREFHLGLGLKAGMRRRDFGLFATMMPGIVSSSQVFDILPQTQGFTLVQKRLTSFSLDLGGAFEVYPSKRTILRFDMGERLILFQDRMHGTPQNFSFVQGAVAPTLQISTGLSFRLGKLYSPEAEPRREIPKFEIGAQFASLHLQNSITELHHEPGIGGRLTYNFNKYFSADSEVNYFPRNPHAVGPQDGGSILEGLIGAKAGIRQRRIGVFVKARPGFLSYGQTVADFSQLPAVIPFTRVTHFALDLGGVVEVYTPKRTFLRFDLGNTLIFARERTAKLFDGTTAVAPGYTQNTMQISTGFGFRF